MRLPLVTAICLIGCGGAIANGTEEKPSFAGKVMVLDIDGEIEVDRTGSVVSHSFAAELPSAVREAATDGVAGWQFVPAATDETTWPVRTKMQIKLVARPGEMAYLEEVNFAVNRKRELESATRPESWPRIEGPDYRVNADVAMYMRFSPSGEIIDAAPKLCTIRSMTRGLGEEAVCSELERNAVRGIKAWKTKHFVQSDPLPVSRQTGVYSAVFGRGRGVQSVGEWRAEWRTPRRAAPWPQEKQRLYDPVLELRDGFIGQPLTRKRAQENNNET